MQNNHNQYPSSFPSDQGAYGYPNTSSPHYAQHDQRAWSPSPYAPQDGYHAAAAPGAGEGYNQDDRYYQYADATSSGPYSDHGEETFGGAVPVDCTELEDLTVMNWFLYHMHQLLLELSNTFDDCPKLADKLAQFTLVVLPSPPFQELFCRGYHKQMGNYYEACARRDPTPFLEERIDFLREIGFSEKYHELTDSSMNTPEEIEHNISSVWKHVDEINKFAQLYCEVPTGIQNALQETTRKLTQQLVNEEITMGDINVLELGKKILEGATENDTHDLMKSMSTIYTAMGGANGVQNMATAGGQEGVPQAIGMLETFMKNKNGASEDGEGANGAASATSAPRARPTQISMTYGDDDEHDAHRAESNRRGTRKSDPKGPAPNGPRRGGSASGGRSSSTSVDSTRGRQQDQGPRKQAQ